MQDPNKKSPVKEVIDNAKTKAFQRGAKSPDWSDIWLSVLEKPAFAKVLQERGVRTGRMAGDLRYASQFGLKGGVKPSDRKRFSKSMLERVYEDIRREAQDFIDKQHSRGRDVSPEAVNEGLEIIHRHMRKLIMTQEQAEPTYLQVKQFALTSLLGDMVGDLDGGDDALLGGLGAMSRTADTARHMNQIINNKYLIDADDMPLRVLESLDANPLQPPSELDVIDMMMAASDGFYTDLLYRNGMLTDNSEREDTLAGFFPDHRVQAFALDAMQAAYASGSREVDVRHAASALLVQPSLQIHLHELGVKDLLSFVEKYDEKAYEKEHGDDSGIRVHPKISDEFRSVIEDFDALVAADKKDDHLHVKMFARVFKKYAEVDKALNKSGLLRRMSRGWMKPITEDEKTRKKNAKDGEDDKKKKEKVFEISDRELDALVEEYCVDYTKLARQRKFDPMIGGDDVMRQVETTLLKRGKKNPIVIGEPGIGKSKVLEGFAQRVVSGKVSRKLVGARVLSLDLHSINTSPYVGVFESRILPILKGVAERNASGRFPPIIIAIDEFNHAMGAGAHSKGDGIRGIIKPYLTSGDLLTIANTTMKEYQTDVKKDGALARRFTPVTMRPPNEAEAAQILTQLQPRFSKHHGIRIPRSAPEAVAHNAERFIHGVNHPDKTLDLMDLACSMAVMDGAKTLEPKYIAKATSSMSGVSESFLLSDDKKRFVELPDTLNDAVLDQPEAVNAVSSSLQRARAGLRSNPEAPIGSYLFIGPTGVGKTELTRALARTLFGSEEFLTRFDMSEFMDKTAANRLIGSNPGYVGFDEGGLLIRAVQDKPYSVILYDEVEKAHPDVFNVLLRPFDSGMITDGRGQVGNMRNTVNIMTANVGAKEVMEEGKRLGINPLDQPVEWQRMAKPIYEEAVTHFFRPEFLNRLDGVIYFNSLSRASIGTLVERQFLQTKWQFAANHFGIDLSIAKEFREAVAANGFDIRYGARPLKRVWQEMVSNPLSQWVLAQDERKLKRAKRLEVGAMFSEPVDEAALFAEAFDNPDGDLTMRIEEINRRVAEAQKAKPLFILG